jgi:hypothetical protein
MVYFWGYSLDIYFPYINILNTCLQLVIVNIPDIIGQISRR